MEGACWPVGTQHGQLCGTSPRGPQSLLMTPLNHLVQRSCSRGGALVVGRHPRPPCESEVWSLGKCGAGTAGLGWALTAGLGVGVTELGEVSGQVRLREDGAPHITVGVVLGALLTQSQAGRRQSEGWPGCHTPWCSDESLPCGRLHPSRRVPGQSTALLWPQSPRSKSSLGRSSPRSPLSPYDQMFLASGRGFLPRPCRWRYWLGRL